jgi:hypothetical protein
MLFDKFKKNKNTKKISPPPARDRTNASSTRSKPSRAMSYSEQQQQNMDDPKRAHLQQRRGQPAAPIITKRKKPFSLVRFFTILLALVVLLITGWLLYYAYGPRWGSIHYGICKVFAERYIEFPHTMRVRDAEYFQYTVRVYVTHIDASGQYRYDQFICAFDPSGTLELVNVRLNRKEVEEQFVKDFNLGINAIILNPPDLKIPRKLSELSIRELWHGEY